MGYVAISLANQGNHHFSFNIRSCRLFSLILPMCMTKIVFVRFLHCKVISFSLFNILFLWSKPLSPAPSSGVGEESGRLNLTSWARDGGGAIYTTETVILLQRRLLSCLFIYSTFLYIGMNSCVFILYFGLYPLLCYPFYCSNCFSFATGSSFRVVPLSLRYDCLLFEHFQFILRHYKMLQTQFAFSSSTFIFDEFFISFRWYF